ncbi:MAG: D-aminoacyl-tRNA deacylase [Candidatus Thermoplasmatota archaeon]
MTVLIISSTQDQASTNIKKSLLKQSNWEEKNNFLEKPAYKNKEIKDVILVTIEDKIIIHENIEQQVKDQLDIKPTQAIFVSKHKSKSGKPSLTTHPIGNYGEAKFGGRNKTLTPAAPRQMTELLRLIKQNNEQANLSYDVCFEVTHHGPYMSIPTMFAEVGSTKKQWIQEKPAEVIAKSLLQLLKKYHYEEETPEDIPVLIGIGGGHYAPRFTDVALNKKSAFGHMIPTYQIKQKNVDDNILEKTIQATPNIEAAYLHRKELKKSQITKYKKWFKKRDIPVISSKKLPEL